MAERQLAFLDDRKPCPNEGTVGVLAGRWKVLLIRELFRGVRRFGELHRSVDGITYKMLTKQLRELETLGVVRRTAYAQVPLRVEYSLTECGQSLDRVLTSLH